MAFENCRLSARIINHSGREHIAPSTMDEANKVRHLQI